MRYILILTTIFIIFAMFLSSCIIEGIDNFISGENIQEENPDKDKESNESIDQEKYESNDPDDGGSESFESESSHNTGSQEIIGRSKNNIMFYSDEANFAFVYPHNDLTLSSYSDWKSEYGDLSLNVSIKAVETLKGEIRDTVIDEREALEKGNFGPSSSFSFEQSRKVINNGDVFVKEFLVFGRYDICDIVFERSAVFYNNGYQVSINLMADKDKIVEGMEQYFTYDEVNCLEEKVWATDGKDELYSQLVSGKAASPALEWYETFDDIMYLLQINDFKGASAGYSRLIDKRYFEEDEKDKYIIDIAYPQFQSAHAGGMDESINKIVYDGTIAPMIDDFKDEILSYDYEDINLRYFLAIDYQVINFNENIISLCLDIYPYMGGAHGMLYFETINFDIERNRLIELKDLFEPGYDYAGTISEYCRRDLPRQMKGRGFQSDEEWIEDGTDPDYTDTLTSFLVAPYGIIMKFPAYQVAPHAAGDFSVTVPYVLFEGFMDPDSVIKEYAISQ